MTAPKPSLNACTRSAEAVAGHVLAHTATEWLVQSREGKGVSSFSLKWDKTKGSSACHWNPVTRGWFYLRICPKNSIYVIANLWNNKFLLDSFPWTALSRLPFTWLILNQCSPYRRFLIAGFSSLGIKPTNCPRDILVLKWHPRSQPSPLGSLHPGITLRHWSCHLWAVFYPAGLPGAQRQCPTSEDTAAVRTAFKAQLPYVGSGHESFFLSSSVPVT